MKSNNENNKSHTGKKQSTVADLRSGQKVYDSTHGRMIHSGLVVVEGLKIKVPHEYIFFTDPKDKKAEPEQIIIKDPNHVVELL